MSKIELNTTISDFGWSQINNNFQLIEDEFNQKVLYRANPVGEPNTMGNDLDMNGKRVFNLPVPSASSEAARLQDVQNAISGATQANLITFSPSGSISSTNVQGAIQELDGDFSAITTNITALQYQIANAEVDTIAALRGVDSTKIDTVFVKSHTTLGDQGGGFYRFDSGDITSSDNNGTIIVGLANARWKLINNGVISVKQFGAKADGVTDDTAAIQAAINWVTANGGGTVFFPDVDYNNGKWYVCASTIFVPGTIDIQLTGGANAMIKSTAVSTATPLMHIGDPADLVQRSAFIKITNIKLWGNGLNGHGIRAVRVNNLRIDNVSLFNHGLNGGYFSDCYTFSLLNSEFVGNGQNGLRLDRASANSSMIVRCKFNDNDTVNLAGIRIEGLHYGVIIDKCDFEFNYFGIWMDGSHAVNITQNYFELNDSAAIFLPPGSTNRGVTVTGNSVFTTLFDFNSVSGIAIEGNTFEQAGTVLNVANCTEVRIGTNQFPGGGAITTNDTGRTMFDAFPAWQAYTPTWAATGTAPAIGNGSIVGSWRRIGKTCFVRILWTAGSTTTFGTGVWSFSLPFTAVTSASAEWYGVAKYTNSGTTVVGGTGIIPFASTGNSNMFFYNPAGTNVTNTSPVAWASGATIQAELVFETA